MMLPSVTPGPEQFNLPDVNRVGPMPSLPAWVASRIASLQIDLQRNPETGRYEQMPLLPASLILTEREKADVLQHVEDLRSLCACTPETSAEAEQWLVLELTKFLSFTPSQGQNEFSAEARGEAFVDALADLPVWAVVRAIKRFRRSDWGVDSQGNPYNYRWCPSPAEFRSIACMEVQQVKGRAEQLERLARAVPRQEFSDEHCARMRERFSELQKLLSSPLVGTDGSGGAAKRDLAEGAHCGTRPKAKPGLKREGGRRRGGDRCK
jgi:hypothetical protein